MNKLLFWTPRILAILAILFISLFAFDSFEQGKPVMQQIAAFAIHLVPSLILTGILILAWKYELAGGIIFTILGAALITWYAINGAKSETTSFTRFLSWGMMLFSPFLISGILFIINGIRSGKRQS